MLDHMLFHNAYWMQRTNDVKEKLANYESLKRKANDLQSFQYTVMSQNNKIFDYTQIPHHNMMEGYTEPIYMRIDSDGTISFY